MGKSQYKEILPSDDLTQYVKCFWCYKNNSDQAQHFVILPDGSFDLILERSSNGIVAISLTGLWQMPVNVTVEPRVVQYAVRFKPAAAEHLLKEKIALLLNNSREADSGIMNANIRQCKSFTRFVREMTSAFSEGIKNTSLNERCLMLFELLFRTNGALTVAEYSEKVRWSKRQINRYFNQCFGLSLKAYCNTLRCFASFEHIKKGKLYPDLTYFDQAHFIKEIKAHTGAAPKDLHKNKDGRFLQFSTMSEL